MHTPGSPALASAPASARRGVLGARLVAAVLALGACGGDTAPAVIDPGDGGVYEPVVDPAAFVDRIDNPFLPLLPGARWVYEGTSDGEQERVEVVVTTERRVVMGINAVVVRDTVTVDGELVEDTFDWFAQDRAGNVWYLGEDSREYEDGRVAGTEGSWEAGVDGALPGIVMPAQPAVGQAYRQEYYRDEAEDLAEVIALDGSASVPFGEYAGLLVTREWTPLEPDSVEEKSYARGVGMVLERQTAGGDGRLGLVEHGAGA